MVQITFRFTVMIVPGLQAICENPDDPLPFNQMFFQQDGAPPHYALAVRNFLNVAFVGHWIGRRGAIEWPPRSPDLTPMDFFLWGHLKSVVYKTKPLNMEDLKNRITAECHKLTAQQLKHVTEETKDRFFLCIEKEGQHIEQFLR